jgi:hypothetical protein
MTGGQDRAEGVTVMVGRSGGSPAPSSTSPVLPTEVNVAVPVMAAVGGSGRSTVAGLTAAGLTAGGVPVLLVDTNDVAESPWLAWIDQHGDGTAALLARRYADQGAVRHATSTWTPAGVPVPVLCDTRPAGSAPLPRPVSPEWWCRLIVTGGWQAGVIDLALAMGSQLQAARHLTGRAGPPELVRWLAAPGSVPVLCTPSSGAGVAATTTAVDLVERAGLDTARLLVAVVDVAGPRVPGRVTAQVGLLADRVGGLVRVPYEARVRAAGLQGFARAGLDRVCAELAGQIVDRVRYLASLPSGASPAPARAEESSGGATEDVQAGTPAV